MQSSLARHLQHRGFPLVIAMCASLLVAACSGAASPAASAPLSTIASAGQASSAAAGGGGASSGCPGSALVHFCGHASVSGGVAAEADVTASWPSLGIKDCAGWLNGNSDDPTMLDLPSPDFSASFSISAAIQHYKGPGTYAVTDFAGTLGPFQVEVGANGWTPSGVTTGSMTVNADGSGTLQAKGLQPVGDVNTIQKPVDITVSWTCVN
jgi:hypothetical protein